MMTPGKSTIWAPELKLFAFCLNDFDFRRIGRKQEKKNRIEESNGIFVIHSSHQYILNWTHSKWGGYSKGCVYSVG